EQYKRIFNNTEKLQELIDQLLELSQLESAAIPLKAKEENLVTILRGLIFSFDSAAKQKNIKLTFSCSDDNFEVWADRDKFEKIINNLLSNAFKFTPDGGSITVNVNRINANEKEFAVIKVSDSGIGIPSDKLEKIFDRFYQVDDSSQRSFGGSGIGLALVKELAELHKWKVTVESKENTGTDFYLRIPFGSSYLNENEKVKIESESIQILTRENLFDEKSTLEITEPKELRNKIESNHKPALLIVEDSEDVRNYLSEILVENYKILNAVNGTEGIKIASTDPVDIIVSDIMMPEMDGIEFCRQIKTKFETSHIPVILLTAKAAMESKIEGLETGADDYLTKPFDSRELLVRIKNLLNQRKKLRERFSKEIKIDADSVTTNPVDNEFLKRAIDSAEKNLSNADFTADDFAKELFVSTSQLRRKLVAITGQAPGEFLRTHKLKRAAEMITAGNLSITQIAFEVGFSSPSHFTKAFQQQFNSLPSDFKGLNFR
ncbi:MAG TPA: ATP-binding protein, partial [Ignavibacteriaceae bacterium]